MKRKFQYAVLAVLVSTILAGGGTLAIGATAHAAQASPSTTSIAAEERAPEVGGTAIRLVCVAWKWVYTQVSGSIDPNMTALQGGATIIAGSYNPVVGTLVCVAWDVIPEVVHIVTTVAPEVYEVADAISEPVGESEVEVPSTQSIVEMVKDTLSNLNPFD